MFPIVSVMNVIVSEDGRPAAESEPLAHPSSDGIDHHDRDKNLYLFEVGIMDTCTYVSYIIKSLCYR